MPELQTAYADRQPIGFEGQKVDGEEYNAITRVCETPAGINFGRVVLRGAADQGCILGDATMAADTFLGISVRDVSVRPSAGDKYPEGGNVTVLTQGSIFVRVGEAVAAGDAPLYDHAAGNFRITAAAGRIALPAGWVFDTAAANGGLAKLVKR